MHSCSMTEKLALPKDNGVSIRRVYGASQVGRILAGAAFLVVQTSQNQRFDARWNVEEF